MSNEAELNSPGDSNAQVPSAGVDGQVASETERAYDAWPYVDRRSQDDRRHKPTGLLDSILGRARRQKGRRLGEDRNIYVDVYGRREIVLVVAILVLNILDAYFTLDYLDKGGAEANPIAQGLLDLGNSWFIYAKSVLVGICLLFLLIHKKFSYVNLALTFLCSFYTLLLGYHIFLQVHYYVTH